MTYFQKEDDRIHKGELYARICLAYAQHPMGEKDVFFFEAVDIVTQWKQEWFKYTPHQFTSKRKYSVDRIPLPSMLWIPGFFPFI